MKMFTHPVRIEKNTIELRAKLKQLGYEFETCTGLKCDGDFIETYMNGLAISYEHDNYKALDCGLDEGKFLRYASLTHCKSFPTLIANYMVLKYDELVDEAEKLNARINEQLKNAETYQDFVIASADTMQNLNAVKVAMTMKMHPEHIERCKVSDNACIMTLKEFVDCVMDGGFTDEDGYGFYCEDDEIETNIQCSPSAIKAGYIHKHFKYISWYNK